MTILYHRVTVERILALRHAVLRPELPPAAACFDGDLAPTTIHLAADSEATIVGCATFMTVPLNDEPAYQLRGMATAPAWRGRGLGRGLLEYAEVLLRDDPVRLRWCNARLSAIGFYEAQGWMVMSERFDIPTAGPHHRMLRRV